MRSRGPRGGSAALPGERVAGRRSASAQKVEAVLCRRYNTLWKNYELGLFDLRLTEVPRGTLRTGRKLRRLVDERKF